MKKRIYIVLFVLLIVSVGVYVYKRAISIQYNKEKESKSLDEASYAPELEFVLNSKMQELSILMREPDILDYIERSNEQYSNIEAEKLLDIDAYWETTPDDNLLLDLFTTNKAARKVKEFKKSHVIFIDIFITDKHGFNVAQTSRTSDIYQADEEWWVKAYNGGEGKSFIGAIKFDDDFLMAGIAVHVPVVNPASHEIIGIAKGLISIESIKSEL